ncbi:MAG: hypothetical protein ACLUEQ_12220 [Cloacibacillus evryensis]
MRKIYPLRGNEGVIGLEYFPQARATSRRCGLRTGKRLVLSGP